MSRTIPEQSVIRGNTASQRQDGVFLRACRMWQRYSSCVAGAGQCGSTDGDASQRQYAAFVLAD